MSHAISFSLFSDIELEENGAGLSISKSSSVSSIHHCMFINCYSHQSGAGIYIDHCSVQIRFCCFNQCKSKGAIAICNIGSDELIEFFFISTDSCSTIPESKDSEGATIHIYETKSTFSNYNSTNNKVNHIATSENSNSPSADIRYFNSIGNSAVKEGVIVQFNTVPSNSLTFSNFVSNSCNNLPLIRFYSCTGTVSYSNFILNQCETIVTQSSIQVLHCYDDGKSSFGPNIQSKESSILSISSKQIECIYFLTQYKTNKTNKYLKFITSFLFINKQTN